MAMRPAIIRDSKPMRELVLEQASLILDAPQKAFPEWFLQSLSDEELHRFISDESAPIYVYEKEQTVFGFISLIRTNHIRHLFVRKQFHRQGIAKQLFRHAIAEQGLSKVTVKASVYAIPFYSRLGFKSVAGQESKEGIAYLPMQWLG